MALNDLCMLALHQGKLWCTELRGKLVSSFGLNFKVCAVESLFLPYWLF